MFWKFFSETLRFSLILKGGALAVLAKAIAKKMNDAHSNILWLREQFFPQTCELQFLDLHGQARGLVRAPIETDDMWRKRVIHAAAWHKLAGKTKGLKKILEQSGYPGTEIKELTGERWAEFILNVPRPESMSIQAWDHIIWLANEYKRASAKLASVVISLQARATCRLKASALYGEKCRIYPLATSKVRQGAAVNIAAAFKPGYEKVIIRPMGVNNG